MKYQLDFYTEYNQFYICDKTSQRKTDSIGFWTTTAFEDRLAIESGILGVGIQSYGHVKCEVDLLNKINRTPDLERYDHVVEAGIDAKSGTLQILSCPTSDIELEFKIRPGIYQVRIYSSNLTGTDIDENEGSDNYKIEIWPDTNMQRKVLKRYISK